MILDHGRRPFQTAVDILAALSAAKHARGDEHLGERELFDSTSSRILPTSFSASRQWPWSTQ